MSNLVPLMPYEIIEPGVELVTNRAGRYLLRRIEARLTDEERLTLSATPRVEDALCFLMQRAVTTANAAFTPPGLPSYLCLKKIREVEGGALSLLLIGQEPEKFDARVIENVVRVIFPDVLYAEFMERVQAAIASNSLTEPGGWLPLPPELALPVDRSVQALARYNAGQFGGLPVDGDGRRELPVRGGRAKRVERLAVLHCPPPDAPAPVRAEAPPATSEVKARVLVACLAFAADSPNPGRFLVRFKDLMSVVGYQLGKTANTRTYWQNAAEVLHALALDLPSQVLHLRYIPPGAKKPVLMEQYLMHRPRLLSGQRAFPEGFVKALAEAEARGGKEATIELIRNADIEGFELGFSPDVLEALGFKHGARERVPRALLGLKGRAFWLGYEIAFYRRWSNQPQPRRGRALLEELADHGYLKRFSRNAQQKVRFSDALTAWWEDVGKLIEIGLLEGSGVKLYRQTGGTCQHVSDTLSRLKEGGGRVTRELLDGITVVYEIPSGRKAALASVRDKHRRLKNTAQRAKAASEGRRQVG